MYTQILCKQIAWLIEVQAEENSKKFITRKNLIRRKDYDYTVN